MSLLLGANAHQPLFFDLENRYYETIRANPWIPITMERVISTRGFDSVTYEEDPVQTWNLLRSRIDENLQNVEARPDYIGVDGIADLRSMAHLVWCKRFQREHAVNPGDWGTINNMVNGIIAKLINYTNASQERRLVLTTLMDDVYDDANQKTALKEFAAKPFILAQMSELALLKRLGHKFTFTRGKSPIGPSETLDITHWWEVAVP